VGEGSNSPREDGFDGFDRSRGPAPPISISRSRRVAASPDDRARRNRRANERARVVRCAPTDAGATGESASRLDERRTDASPHSRARLVMRARTASSVTASTSGRRVDLSSRARRVVSRRSGGEDDAPRRRLTDAELRAAVDEAREILREATLAANEQARMELTRGMSADADADADAAAIECLRVEAFLRARGGLNEIQAERVARELYAMG
jgi:hypothetical protein